MTPPQPTTPRQPDRSQREEIESLRLRLEQVERTLSAVAREAGDISVAGPCTRCQRSLLLVKDGQLVCPACSYSRSI